MSTEFDKLNRLRENAGKNPLKVWKASQEALQAQIKSFEADGFTDALPGANVNATPVIPPEVAELLPKEPETPPTLAVSAMSKNVAEDKPADPPKKKGRAALARGLDTDTMARNCRVAVQMDREREKREKAANKPTLTKEEKKAAKKSAKAAKKAKEKKAAKATEEKVLPKGAVDPKKEPEKAARQKKHIEEKQAARAAKPKADKNSDEVTVADMCRKLDIDPKVGRAKLRRHEEKLKALHTKGQDRWTFPKAAEKQITDILAGKK